MTTKLQTIIHILQTVPVFAQSRVADLELLARSIKYIYATRKEILYRQGDPCEGFHVIVYGRIKMSLISWNGTDKPLQLMDAGCCFGDITMFNGEPYFMDVQALEDCALLYIPRQAVVELIERDSQFAMRMLGSLSARVRGLIGDIESFSLQPPVTRLVTCWCMTLTNWAPSSAKTASVWRTRTDIGAIPNPPERRASLRLGACGSNAFDDHRDPLADANAHRA